MPESVSQNALNFEYEALLFVFKMFEEETFILLQQDAYLIL